ncbi:hypothetical protein TNCV_248051 [Trichonephila clavipes]|nr:hypothetical protein TNCV_248051 [Trichonephila clavipes]
MNMKRKENFQILPKELHQLKYEAISVPQGSVHICQKDTRNKKFNFLFIDHQRCQEFEPSTSKDPPSDIHILSSKQPPQKIRFNKGSMLKMVIVYEVLLFSVQIIPHPPLPKIQRVIYYKIAFKFFTGYEIYEDFFFGS